MPGAWLIVVRISIVLIPARFTGLQKQKNCV